MAEAAGRLQRRPAADASAAAIDTSIWWSLGQQAGQQLFYPPDVGGWDYTRWLDTATFRARWFIAALVQGAGAADRLARRPGEARRSARSSSGASRRSRRRRRRSLTAFAKAQLAPQAPTPRRRDRPAPARRLLPGPPDGMSCYDCNRTELLRRAVAEAGRGLPEIEPGMPLPAGTGLTRRAFVSRTAGLALAVYGGKALSSFALRRRHRARRRRTRPSTQKVLVDDLPERRDRRALGALPGRRPGVLLAAAEPRARADRRASRSPRTRACAGTRRRPGSRRCTARARSRCCRRSATTNSNQSHFTSRHYWEVGATDATLRTGWLGPLPRHDRRARQPAPGADPRRRAPPGDRDREGAGRDALRRPTSTCSHRPGCRRTRSSRRSSRRRRTSAPRTRSRPTRACSQAGQIGVRRRTTSTTSSARSSTASRARSPTRARPIRSRTGSPGSRR